jgi:hypothetical protein
MAFKKMASPYRWATGLLAVALVAGVSRTASGVLIDMAGHWSTSLVTALEAKGIIAGDVSGKFGPDTPLSRAQMAKLLVTGLGTEKDADLLAGYSSRFSDIPSWHWARGYIESLAELDVTEGYPDGRFGPEDTVTRAQMAVFLVRALKLDQQARLMRFESTPYRDDREIPDWARGAVHVALSTGLMSGFDDQSFRPLESITRAEGSVTLLRLLEMDGAAYHLSGTLVRFDPVRLQGVVRDSLGQERSFRMAPHAQYYRGGAAVAVEGVTVMDQVWVVLGADGTGSFLDARDSGLVALNPVVDGRSLRVMSPNGNQQTYAVQPGALVFLNGRVAPLEQVSGATQVYLALDRVTGEVRIADAVTVSVEGELVAFDASIAQLTVKSGDESKDLPVARDLAVFLDGRPSTLEDLQMGDRLRIALSSAGTVVYLEAER